MKTSFHRTLLHVTSAIAIFVVQTTQAATRTKQNNTDDLNLASSWSVALPGANDIASWTSNVATANTVALGADLNWLGLSIVGPGGAVSISAGNTLTLGRGGIDMSAATQDLSIASNLTLNSYNHQVWNIASGRTLSANTGVTTRSPGSTLNIQGAGTVATNLTNNASGIVGNWLTIGTGASTRYAQVSGGNLTSYTGTTSTIDAIGAAPTGNFEASSGGTFGAGASLNTLRYSGGAGNINGAFQANGLMNAGTGTVTVGGNVTIGSEKELVLNTASAAMTLNGVISDNAGGASGITITGSGTVTLQGNNTYTGDTVVTLGTLDIRHNNALGTSAGRTIVSGGAAVPAIAGGVLRLGGSGLVVAESLTLIGLGDSGSSAVTLLQNNNNNTLSGDVTLSGTGSVKILGSSGRLTATGGVTADADSNGILVLNASAGAVLEFTTTSLNLKSTGTFLVDGPGTVELGVGGNTWGTTRVNRGTLMMTTANALPSTAILNVGSASAAALDLNGFNQTTGMLLSTAGAATRTITNGSATAATLSINQTATGTYDGSLSGNMALVKTGASDLTITGAVTQTGNTFVNAGTLILSSTSNSTFTIGANHVNNQIGGTGIANLNGAFTFDLSGAGIAGGNFWTIVDVGTLTGAVFSGTFSVGGFTESSNVWTKSDGANTWTFTESSGVLALDVVPEPSTIGFLALSLVLVPVLCRRRLDAKNNNLPTTI
jgi:autotransporter-associated beta strand protein